MSKTITTPRPPAAAPPLDLSAIGDLISTAERDVSSLTAQRQRHAVNLLRRLPNADADYGDVQTRFLAAVLHLQQLREARAALEDEQAAAKVARSAAETARLEGERVAAARVLASKLDAVELAANGLAGCVVTALAASDELYNAAVLLGHHGRATTTRDAVETRVSHLLRMSGLVGFDLGRGPAARSPLGNAKPEAVYREPFVEPRPPLPTRRDHHANKPGEGYPGQNETSKPIVSTELWDPTSGTWRSVPPGTRDWPEGGPAGLAVVHQAAPGEDQADAEARRARHRQQDADARSAGRAAAAVKLEGED